jgi:hypothetical protein
MILAGVGARRDREILCPGRRPALGLGADLVTFSRGLSPLISDRTGVRVEPERRPVTPRRNNCTKRNLKKEDEKLEIQK